MKRTRLLRAAIMTAFLLAALLLVYLVVMQTMPDLIPLLESGDEAALEAYLSRDMSASGVLCMALLQMIQVWAIVISGVVVNIAAGVVYGLWRAFAICQLSSTLAHCISFTLCQRLRRRLDRLLPDEHHAKLDLIANARHPGYMVLTLCFLPVLPNGIISVAASRSRLKPWQFALCMLFGTASGTFVYCWLGSSLVRADWALSALLLVLMLAVSFVLWKFQDQILHFVQHLLEKRKKGAAAASDAARR